ncbi:hypothetical protein DA803_02505 [[Mycoplasma] phocae]|uniref:Lipoprotein n=1 Tax=[Mycoplasma] phocae TaxID=142651 RepID=A0A2Z5IQ52_9BACT|nr:hypothetical protein [[Mycoplasma] phocae]AXE60943.1 hypothetical protein DA803_02505 [[Mycoplasma] phocae]
MLKKNGKKTKILISLLATQFVALPIAMVACNNTNKKTETTTNNFDKSDVNREGSLIGDELREKVNDVIKNSSFTFTDLAKEEYNALNSPIKKDQYIKSLWEKITKWFASSKDHLDRFAFLPETLRNPEFRKYLNVNIPNLEYFVGNHEVHCYFDYDETQRNIYYHYKIKCLDGRQNEGQGDVFLNLGQDN